MRMDNPRTFVSIALKSLGASALLMSCINVFPQTIQAQNTQGNRTISSAVAVSRPRRVHPDVPLSIDSNSTSLAEAAIGIERRAFELVNETRLKKGLPSLTWDPELCQLARLHSQNMATQTVFSHVTRDGRST